MTISAPLVALLATLALAAATPAAARPDPPPAAAAAAPTADNAAAPPAEVVAAPTAGVTAALAVAPSPEPGPADAPALVPPPEERPAGASTSWRWPLHPRPPIARPFGVGPHRWSAGHRGVDLRAAPGAQVRSAGPGAVALSRVVAGRPVVVVAHPGGLRTTYEPVAAAVPAGTPVHAGSVIGHLEPGGHCTPACLHWGALRGRTYLDPLTLLGLRRPVILLPYLDDG